jgi:hypothetical protein
MSCSRGCCASFGEHVRSLRVALPTEQGQAVKSEQADLEAYRRLRETGAQPKTYRGAAELERGASTLHEVEHGNIVTDDKLRRRVTQIFADAPAATLTPTDAA